MSGLSEKQRMRDALALTDRNLSSLINAKVNMASGAMEMERAMIDWRNVVLRAMGYLTEERECICPRCGVRHGLSQRHAGF